MRYKNRIAASLSYALLLSATTAINIQAADPLANGIKIGILTFNPDDAETRAYREYLENYLGEAFDAEFYYSDATNTLEEEITFIEQMHEMDIHGIIGNLSEEAMALCEEYGIYYIFGSATVSDDVFENIKANNYFLGTISASLEEEKEASKNMVSFFVEDEQKDEHGFIICTGGANELHRVRSEAILETLLETYGITSEKNVKELLENEEIFTISDETIKITVIPGYPEITPLAENVESVSAEGGYDTLLSVMSIHPIIDSIRKTEEALKKDIRVGCIDSFTQEAENLYNTEDPFGNPELNYLTGTHGAMIASSFVALCNAYTDNMDMVRDNGEAFRLYRNYWTATNKEEFNELYAKTISLYDNAYGAVDIMKVLKEFNPEVTFEEYRAFVER